MSCARYKSRYSRSATVTVKRSMISPSYHLPSFYFLLIKFLFFFVSFPSHFPLLVVNPLLGTTQIVAETRGILWLTLVITWFLWDIVALDVFKLLVKSPLIFVNNTLNQNSLKILCKEVFGCCLGRRLGIGPGLGCLINQTFSTHINAILPIYSPMPLILVFFSQLAKGENRTCTSCWPGPRNVSTIRYNVTQHIYHWKGIEKTFNLWNFYEGPAYFKNTVQNLKSLNIPAFGMSGAAIVYLYTPL